MDAISRLEDMVKSRNPFILSLLTTSLCEQKSTALMLVAVPAWLESSTISVYSLL